MGVRAIHAFVEGEVQGVGFRAYASREAFQLGIFGWVRNTADGEVETWAEGESLAVEEYADWLKRGPSTAWVREVRLSEEKPTGKYSAFSIVF